MSTRNRSISRWRTGDLEALAKVVKALRSPTRRLRFVYEAGPCGFGIHRYLTAQGEECVVVNPSSMPKRSGDRIKTDRRDGDALARLHRAGELTAIYIPTPDDEALRDLVRAREDAVGLSTQAKHRLKAFLLRQGRRYPGRAGWTVPYRRWLADLSFPLAPQHIALQEYRDTIDETERRVERLTDQLRTHTPDWRWAPVVDALQALRGVSFVTAVGLVAEIGDIRRFTPPRELMAYLGLVPSEYSSGPAYGAAALPRRAIRTHDDSSRKRPGRIRAFRALAGRGSTGKKDCQSLCVRLRGRRSSD
jgi:transposase